MKYPFLGLIIHISGRFETPQNFVANYAPIPPHRTLVPPHVSPPYGGGTGPPPCQNLYGYPIQILAWGEGPPKQMRILWIACRLPPCYCHLSSFPRPPPPPLSSCVIFWLTPPYPQFG